MHLFNTIKINYVFVLIGFFMAYSNAYGQGPRDGVLEITGWLLNDDDEPLRRADVLVYDGPALIVEEKTNRRGRFRFDLPVDRNYTVVFSAESYAPKKISFNTGLPNNFDGFNAFYFEFLVELFPKVQGVDYSLLETPFIEVAYLPDMQEFFFEESKAQQAIAQVEQIKQQTYEMIALRKEYDEIIADADRLFSRDNYDDATKLYNEALSLLPGEEHPKNRLREMMAYEEPEVIKEDLALADDNNEEYITLADDPSDKIAEIVFTNGYSDEIDNHIADALVEDVVELAQNNATKVEDAQKDIIEELIVDVNETFASETKIEQFFEDSVLMAHFGFASYFLNEYAIEALDVAISKLRSDPDINLVVHGHTDKRGETLFNFYLSQLRAHAAFKYCVDHGIDPGRILTLAHGQNNLLVKNAKKEVEHKKNRRIEINLMEKDSFNLLADNIRNESFRKLNDLSCRKSFPDDVEFMVQFIASNIPVGTSFFHRILNEYKEADIIYYYDNDQLHRYLIGSYNTIEDATNAALRLHSLGYQAYVVAFSGSERISVSRARAIQASMN